MDARQERSTSIFVFQEKESLAGFAARCASLSEHEFLQRHPDPCLLTSMPTGPDDAAEAIGLSVVIPVRKKVAAPSPDKSGAGVALAANRVFIGRGPECDVVLTPKSVSRRHLVLEKQASLWHVIDLGSTNGSRVEGKLIQAKVYSPIHSSPVRIELGSDVMFWFLLPQDLFAYLSCLAQISETTSRHKIQPAQVSEKTPPETNSLVGKLEDLATSKSALLPPPRTREQIAEAETGALTRPEAFRTWGDDETEERRAVPDAPLPVSVAPQASSEDPSPKLQAALRLVAALDYFIMTVSVTLKADGGRPLTIYSPSSDKKVTDVVVPQLLRYGPLMKTVTVTLSVGDGKPVEIYCAD